MTALAIVGVIVATVALGCVVLIAVLCFRALSRAYQLLDSIHDRDTKQIAQVVDRFMAADFAAYKSFAMAEQSGDASQYIPESLKPPPMDEEHPVSGEDWGALSPRQLIFEEDEV